MEHQISIELVIIDLTCPYSIDKGSMDLRTLHQESIHIAFSGLEINSRHNSVEHDDFFIFENQTFNLASFFAIGIGNDIFLNFLTLTKLKLFKRT